MKQAFEVKYSALQAPLTANGAAVVFGRAIAAMVDSCYVRTAGVPMFFNRDGFGISVTCESRQALEGLPLTYGSVIGHFGELERGAVYAVPAADYEAVFALAPAFASYPTTMRQRLAREVGGRLADYLAVRLMAVRVRVPENGDRIVVSGAVAEDFAALPVRFNGVFERLLISAV